jgi:SAM-dependent methyltransferase
MATHPKPILPPPEALALPRGYRQQPGNFTLDANRDNGSYWADWRLAESGRHQFHVYRWAARLIRREGFRSVLDVGCGPCTKLQQHIVPVCRDVEGIDQPSALAAARKRGVTVKLTPVDLEAPALTPARTFDLIICADVLEHLVDPGPALRLIRSFAHGRSLVLLSTPERHRQRGRRCMASAKPEHVREWSRPEFSEFTRSRGLIPVFTNLFPGDDSPVTLHRAHEARFRAGREETSPMSCLAVLCRLAHAA